MFIRKTKTRSTKDSKDYYTYRLVKSIRENGKVVQKTILNLGADFDLEELLWKPLCCRVKDLLASQQTLIATEPEIEEKAQYLYNLIIQKKGEIKLNNEEADYHNVDVNSLEQINPRSIGVEHISLEALKELDIAQQLKNLGFNGYQTNAVLANIISRMCKPQSEHATLKWLKKASGLGELIDYDFEKMSLSQLYRASDKLVKHKDTIEEYTFERIKNIFTLSPTIALYDLTNTYFEGSGKSNTQAKRGRSKEKRSDCPLITLGMVLDSSGFARSSKVFEGNVSEPKTLSEILNKLSPCSGALIIMDAGIATEDNLHWLLEKGYNYLVVSRKRNSSINKENAQIIENKSGHSIYLERKEGSHEKEIELACWSEQRHAKEKSIQSSFNNKFEEALIKLNEGLSKPRTLKSIQAVHEKIGRLKERNKRVSSHYSLNITEDQETKNVTSIQWNYNPPKGKKSDELGVYSLRTTMTQWSSEDLWRTYTMLIDLESVFRSLKSELGIRPIYHQKEERCDGHLFITVLAYQAVQVIRRKLKEAGMEYSWSSLRDIVCKQQRVTAKFCRKEGDFIHVRQATKPDKEIKEIYKILNVTLSPGGIRKRIEK